MATVTASEVRKMITEAQIDFGVAESIEDFLNLRYKHFGPDSPLAALRRKMADEEDDR